MAVDAAGGLYVADISNSRVLHFPNGIVINIDVICGGEKRKKENGRIFYSAQEKGELLSRISPFDPLLLVDAKVWSFFFILSTVIPIDIV